MSVLNALDSLIAKIDDSKEGLSSSDVKCVDLTSNFKWFNAPTTFDVKPNKLSMTCEYNTDLWQTPDINRDSGHFFYTTIEGNFISYVKITGEYDKMYDQIGIMIRKDIKNWVKCGIEYIDVQNVSAVVTKTYSDWNLARLDSNPKSIYIKLSRDKAKIMVEYSLDNNKYYLLRKFQFFDSKLQIGLMGCSPKRANNDKKFKCLFENFVLIKTDSNVKDPCQD
mmetsp:Transcript_24855/g.30300  ORF Transcript_24855/g.30300 Transcript_24855/m.30300 type:complete len:223 (+) Transcript_24855:27-695(+)